MAIAHLLGFPRIGAQRELKFAVESFWKGDSTDEALHLAGRTLRMRHWDLQRAAGLDFVTVGDFAWYDHVLSTLAHLGCLPARFGFDAATLSLTQYFAMARGNKEQPAMEMTKWFDTNYHYLVPEWRKDMCVGKGVSWLYDEVQEAQAQRHAVKAVIVGPLTLLYLGKVKGAQFDKLDLLPQLISTYQRLLAHLKAMDVQWVQIDEPILGLELEPSWVTALAKTYTALAPSAPDILLATYFESVAEHRALLQTLPVAGVHLDLVRGRGQSKTFLDDWPESKVLSLGVIDGRNIWRADLDAITDLLLPAQQQLGERLWVSASCSLLHVPVDLACEDRLAPDVRNRLAFARQKVNEIIVLKQILANNVALSTTTLAAGRMSPPKPCGFVRDRLAAVADADMQRASHFDLRIHTQRARLNLPPVPTTTIGSFPQTTAIRAARAAFKRGKLGFLEYLEAMRTEIRLAISRQETLGLDVLVHGEPERNDMVEYFGEQLAGYAFTLNGWVQSYGSRCVKPPIIHGDIYRLEPMTVGWASYAQSLTEKPVKGMLTGPVTMLQWSFVRDDQPRETTALQIALALREEVLDLEKAGIVIIQIDEPAFREGLPLKRRDWPGYLDWAVRAFKLAACGVSDATQIHTHMCYAEFNDILPAIAALDADVITIETSRSDMELLDGFGASSYPNDIGPGLYDIHSPRVPTANDMLKLLEKAARVIPVQRLWANPDCGLKTRDWPETETALANMVEAARLMRARVIAEVNS